MTNWAKDSPSPPRPYPREREFMADMPVAAPEPEPAKLADSSCNDCTLSERGRCGKCLERDRQRIRAGLPFLRDHEAPAVPPWHENPTFKPVF